jgi:hypothetical protein
VAVRFARNSQLFSLDALRSIGGSVSIENNPLLDGRYSLFSALEEAGGLRVVGNLLLGQLVLPRLARVPWLSVTDNPILPTCQVHALVAQLNSQPVVSISGNDDLATCP